MKEVEPTPFDVDVEDDAGRAYPWAPQPGETDLGFHLFTLYRDMPPGKRTISALSRDCGRSTDTLRALSAKFSWQDRALAFDAFLDARAVEELVRGRTRMKQEHLDMALLAREKIVARLKTMNPLEMSVRDMATWAELATKIERQARGEADRKIEISGEVSVVETLDASSRRSLMAEALAVLNERLGVGQIEEAFVEGEVVEDEGGRGEADGRTGEAS